MKIWLIVLSKISALECTKMFAKVPNKYVAFDISKGLLSFSEYHIVWKLLKMLHLNFWHFPPIISLLKKVTSGFQKLAKLSIQNVKVARFARNVEWDCNFQTIFTKS